VNQRGTEEVVMGLSDTVFHLVHMQIREEWEAKDRHQDAARRNATPEQRLSYQMRAANHEAKAAALGVAIAALVDLPWLKETT
jgi:hypothetical protein